MLFKKSFARITLLFLALLLVILVERHFAHEGTHEILTGECPHGTTLLTVETFPFQIDRTVPAGKRHQLYAAVLVRGSQLKKLGYLHTRSDGWTNLSSEKDHISAGSSLANCLPDEGMYVVRIEYYTRVPFIGDWLSMIFEDTIALIGPKTVKFFYITSDYRGDFIIKQWGVLKMPTPGDYLKMYWPLFTVYALSLILFLAGLAAITFRLARQRKKVAPRDPSS